MDKRIEKTKQKIKEKYIELLFKKDPNDIQVKELCLLANINRSTFYDRYGYLDALVDEIIEEEINKITSDEILSNIEVTSNILNKSAIKRYVELFYSNKILVRFSLMDNKDFYVGKIIHKQIEIAIKKLNTVSYYQTFFQVVGSLSTLIEFLCNKRNHQIDDIVNIVYEHTLLMLKEEFK